MAIIYSLKLIDVYNEIDQAVYLNWMYYVMEKLKEESWVKLSEKIIKEWLIHALLFLLILP